MALKEYSILGLFVCLDVLVGVSHREIRTRAAYSVVSVLFVKGPFHLLPQSMTPVYHYHETRTDSTNGSA